MLTSNLVNVNMNNINIASVNVYDIDKWEVANLRHLAGISAGETPG